MSDSNWGDKRVTATNLVGAGTTLAITAVLIWTASANYTEIRIKAENYAAHYSDATVQDIERTCVGTDLSVRAKCETEIINSTREAKHDAEDLQAQRQAARWGGLTLIVTGIGACSLYSESILSAKI